MKKQKFKIPFNETFLVGDTLGLGIPRVLFIHGAGSGDRSRFEQFRIILAEQGVTSIAFDFIGHGETGGNLIGSSLESRIAQASVVIDAQKLSQPISIVASSMGGYIAIKLSERYSIKNLVLIAPAVYNTEAYCIPFGSEFTNTIRSPFSWRDTDAWSILESYTGRLLVWGAEKDQVIPTEVIERIYESAHNAESREKSIIKDATHSLAKWLNEHQSSLNDVSERVCQLFKTDQEWLRIETNFLRGKAKGSYL